MIDKYFQKILHHPLRILAKFCFKIGLSANAVTLSNVLVSCLVFFSLLSGWYLAGLIFVVINRIFDGLDGAIARYSHTSNPASGYLDIMVDFLFYISVPLAFALRAPEENAVAASLVLAGYVLTGVNFMATAAVAAKLGIKSISFPNKAIYYASNIVEGTETIFYCVLVSLLPNSFATISYILAAILFITMPMIVLIRWKTFSKQKMFPSLMQ